MSMPMPNAPTVTSLSPTPMGTTRRIKVLHFHSSKGLYGPERWTHLALRTLAGSEIDQEVLTIGTKPGYEDFSRFMRREGFPGHHLAIGGKIGPGHILAIRDLLVAQRIDVLHTHGFKTDVLGYLATRGLPIGLVTTPHGWCDHESLRIRAYETVGRLFLHGFDRVYPLSDHQMAVLRPYGLGARVRRIRNAVDISSFDAIYANRKTAAPRDPTLLFVGRMAREKGLFDLLKAAALVPSRHALRIIVAGEGPGDAEARAIAERGGIAARTTFVGFVEDVRPLLREATVLALPSYSEGIPRVVMEAFAAGVAVVGTQIPGLRELVEPDRCGLLVPVGDISALARALETLLTDAATNRRMTEHARTVIERDYSPHRLASELREEYTRLVDRQSGRTATSRVAAGLTPTAVPPVWDTAASSDFVRHWQALLASNDNLYSQYQSPEWWHHMIASGVATDADLAVVADDNGVAGIAPIRVRKHPLEFAAKGRVLARFALRSVTLLGGAPLARHDAAVHDELYAQLLEREPKAECLYIHSVQTNSFAWSHLQSSEFIRQNFVPYLPDGIRPFHYLTLPESFQTYLQQQFRAKKRYNLNRQLRLLREALGDTRCERIDAPDNVPRLFEAAASVLPRAWQRTLSPTGAYEVLRFPDRVRDLAERGLLRSYVLSCGSTPRALVLGYQFRGVYHYAEIAYDETIAKYSPGTSLLYLLIEDLFEHDRPRHVNFGIGDAEYKRGFSNMTTQDASVVLFRKTFRNHARLLIHRTLVTALRAAKSSRRAFEQRAKHEPT